MHVFKKKSATFETLSNPPTSISFQDRNALISRTLLLITSQPNKMRSTLHYFLVVLLAMSGVDSQGIRRVMTRTIGTKYGTIRGLSVKLPNRNVGAVEVFLGIPYAAPPVGHLRFMPPVNPGQWRGVKTADRYGPVCPQRYPDIKNETESLRHMPTGRLEYLKKLIPFLRNESEDCLYLNVYVPGKTV